MGFLVDLKEDNPPFRGKHEPFSKAEVAPASSRSTLIVRMRQVVLQPGENGYWVAEVPSLPGCISQGASKEEAITHIREAIGQWIEAAESLGRDVPAETFDVHVCVVGVDSP